MKPLNILKSGKAISLLVVFTLLAFIGINPTASADSESPLQIYINEKYISYEVNPIMVNEHILVPVKKTLENFGATVTWEESIQMLTARKSETTVTITTGSYNATVNGRVKNLAEPVQIIEGQTFAPLDFLVESFDSELTWDKEKQVIRIYCGSKKQGQNVVSTTTTKPPGQMPAVSPPVTAQQSQVTVVSPPVIEQQGPTTAVSVTADDLHIRSGPSTSSDVIGLVPCGTILAYVGEKDGWYQVKYQGQSGWVASWYVTPPIDAVVPGGAKKATLLPVPSDPEGFVLQMKRYAEVVSKGTGLPVNFLLAQWAEESGYGTSSLAQYYNNFGGIKAPDTGGFREYLSPDEFAQDVIRIYTEHSQYDKLLADARAGASLKTLFNDLSRCGYASSKNYGEKIRTEYLPTIDEILANLK
ncbi:MAG: stalk domain-containing protein [Syntrophomonas sp.]